MAKLVRIFRATALAASFATVAAYGALPALKQPSIGAVDRISEPLAPVNLGPDITDFYRDRGFRPVWIADSKFRPEVAVLMRRITPDSRLNAALRNAASGDPRWLARADLFLTKAYVDQVASLMAPPSFNDMNYVDAELRPRSTSLRRSLDELDSGQALGPFLQSAARGNPVLEGLVRGLIRYCAEWAALPQFQLSQFPDSVSLGRRLGLAHAQPAQIADRLLVFQRVHGLPETGNADAATIAALNRGGEYYERLIQRNIDRARAIRSQFQGRYILVDTASARLWLIEDGAIRDGMRVIVGKTGMQTPIMAGMMRHVVLNPYWNLPPDLIRQRARNAVRRGVRVITGERLQVLSDWSEDAIGLNPNDVNWSAVASGRQNVNLRQRPGPQNMMGAVKFMFPNDLGIYLHDTPFRELFAQSDRRLSSGCVRVQDAARLARWVFQGSPPRPSGIAEQEVALPQPVPVYITYLTALPTGTGIVFQSDTYGRDGIRTVSTRSLASRARL